MVKKSARNYDRIHSNRRSDDNTVEKNSGRRKSQKGRKSRRDGFEAKDRRWSGWR